MPRSPAILTVPAALLLAATLTGCAGLPPFLASGEPSSTEPAAPGASDSPTSSAGDGANDPTTSPEQQFFDNLALMRMQLTGFDPEGDRRLEGYPSVSWDEATEAARGAVVEVGESACRKPMPKSSEDPGDRQMLWLSARFLCPDRLAEAEEAFEQFGGTPGGAQLLDIYRLSTLRGDRTADDALTALTLCAAEVDLAWTLPEGFAAPQTFCWMVRVNALDARNREADFVELFVEGGDSAVSFDEIATDLGARPNALAEDAEDAAEPEPEASPGS